jgi:hypothetical protein
MKVAILKRGSAKAVANYEIILGGLNYTPQEREYFNDAWRLAIQDGLVKDEDREKYEFRLLTPKTPS